MSNLLDDVQVLDELIRELEKINSKMENGHFIHAWRDNRRIISKLQQMRNQTIKKASQDEE